MLLKKISCLLLALMVSFCFSLTVFADGVGDGTPQDDRMVFSYWNIDYIYATRVNDGAVVLFEFPNDFFYRSMTTEETITLYGKTESGTTVSSAFTITFYGVTIDSIDYMYVNFVNTAGFKDIQIQFTNSVIHPMNSIQYSIVTPPFISVPFFQINADTSSDPVDITSSAVESYSSQYSYVVPNGEYDLAFVTRSGSYSDLSFVNVDGYRLYNLTMPQTELVRIKDLIASRGYPSYATIPYFDSVTVQLNLYESYVSSDIAFYLPVGTCDSDLGYIAGGIRVSQWYDLYYGLRGDDPDLPAPVDPTMPTDVAKGAAKFIGAVLTGIFAIEMFPQIFIGGIVFCIFGMAFVFAFLRWFRGG